MMHLESRPLDLVVSMGADTPNYFPSLTLSSPNTSQQLSSPTPKPHLSSDMVLQHHRRPPLIVLQITTTTYPLLFLLLSLSRHVLNFPKPIS